MPDPIPGQHDHLPVAPTVGGLHHVELWVPDFGRATASWEWLLAALGYTRYQEFPNGVSWRHPGTGVYIVLEQSPDMLAIPHDRHRPGLNHLAFLAGDRAAVERLAVEALAHGWTVRERIVPAAGEAGYEATHLTDRDGFEVELVVASPDSRQGGEG
ncbi:MAG TPA: VOC family protein [Thermomicrobiales bacterium]|nr:VOC family protein [Thermomicrobiales bacterium]